MQERVLKLEEIMVHGLVHVCAEGLELFVDFVKVKFARRRNTAVPIEEPLSDPVPNQMSPGDVDLPVIPCAVLALAQSSESGKVRRFVLLMYKSYTVLQQTV